jgi:hypothetical protein
MNVYMNEILYLIPEQIMEDKMEVEEVEKIEDEKIKEPELNDEEKLKLELEFCEKIKKIEEKSLIKESSLDHFNRESYWNEMTKNERSYFIVSLFN